MSRPPPTGIPWKRWARIALRTLHLVGTAGAGGGFLYDAPSAFWEPYLWLTLASGVVLAALEVWSNPVWLVQLRGVAVLAKVALLACVPLAPQLGAPILVAVIVLSGVFSHAPASVRYWSVVHRRTVERFGAPD